MKRVFAALFGTVTGLVMLLNFKTHNSTAAGLPAAIGTANTGTGTAAGSGSGSGSGNGQSGTTSKAPAAGSTKTATSGTKTYTGSSVDTQFGPVQVRITVTNGKLSGVTAINYPTGSGTDQEINSYAIPQLNQEALAAGSAQIDMVSGATYTSGGYIQSLQSALNQAGL